MVLNKGTKVPFPLNHDDASYAKAISEAQDLPKRS